MIGTQEAAQRLGVTVSRVRQFVSDGRLPAQRITGVLLFDEDDIAKFSEVPRKRGRQKGYSRSAAVIAQLEKEAGR